MALTPTQPVNGGMAREREQPGRELLARIEVVEMLPGTHKGVLRDFLGVNAVAKQAPDKTENGTLVPRHHFAESWLIVLARQRHQLDIRFFGDRHGDPWRLSMPASGVVKWALFGLSTDAWRQSPRTSWRSRSLVC
jgi:hypothetical protein